MITRVAERITSLSRSLDRQRRVLYSSSRVESTHRVPSSVSVIKKQDFPAASDSELLNAASRTSTAISFPTVSPLSEDVGELLSRIQEWSTKQTPSSSTKTTEEVQNNGGTINPCGIQMLPKSLHQQVFKGDSASPMTEETLAKIKDHLTAHNLWGRPTPAVQDIDLKLPELLGSNLSEHFERLAEDQCAGYREKVLQLIGHQIPVMPEVWSFAPGWTRYEEGGRAVPVDFPDEDAYVFDVEVCVLEGQAPTIATAVSNSHWYSWCSRQLFDHKEGQVLSGLDRQYSPKDLINLETSPGQGRLPLAEQKERIVIGHNVSYDRARVKEQYFVDKTRLRFLDTMALHIAVSGITSYQRNILMSGKGDGQAVKTNKPYWKGASEEILEWKNLSSFNGLNDVHQLYCGGPALEKEKRSVFVTGSLSDIKEDFQQLVTYCARDTKATYEVLAVLFPEYQSRFPHPVTLAGMLEMGSAYLPVNRNWQRYLHDSEDTYRELEDELTRSLKREADRACHLMEGEAYKSDPWLWDLDWSVQPLKIKKAPVKGKKNKADKADIVQAVPEKRPKKEEEEEESALAELEARFSDLMASKAQLFKKPAFLPGYPAWYRSLCDRDEDGLVGPAEMTTAAQAVPKLLKLSWDGYPLHHSRELGWGYLVPGRPLEYCRPADPSAPVFPLKEALELFPPRPDAPGNGGNLTEGMVSTEDAMKQLQIMSGASADPVSLALLRQAAYSEREPDENDTKKAKKAKKADFNVTADRPSWHQGIGPYDVGVPGCWFFRLPHKSGVDNNVGNPLAKDYLSKIEDGTLRATSSAVAERVLRLNRNIIYWRNARDRITSQMVVWLDPSQLPNSVVHSDRFDPAGNYGAIVPQVITSGTLTRRAVESTWMTASNAYKDRLGSELKAMVQVPPGFSLVGADVDSQELWIASLIGDAHFAGQHGSTAFGWMTLQGRKSDGTDMHSRTAQAASISRDQAKVLNYGRIYGAGERFAKTLLMQFNHRLTEEEAVEKARRMYSATKGDCAYRLNHNGRRLAALVGLPTDRPLTREEILSARKSGRKLSSSNGELADLLNLSVDELTERRVWVGGTESDMFNKLEEIAQSDSPRTPALGCRISRALEPANVGREFMTSRVNWVVQSSAVDYLHLMVVAMKYLCDRYGIDGRFCISIHDEVRYLVKEEDKYRAALALQVTNLWTRSMFAHRLGLNDLPITVAFFSSVDIDTVLRKETNMDCETPSNPYGLRQGYGVPFGSSLDIHEILEKTKGSLSTQDLPASSC